MNKEFSSFSHFWPHYLLEHSKPETRLFHYLGTSLGFIFIILGVLNSQLFYLLALVSAYGLAWFSHYFIEKNKPATFKHPLWSLLADLRMFFLWLFRKLGPHLKNAGILN